MVRTLDGVKVASTKGTTAGSWDADALVWGIPYTAVSGVGDYTVTVTIDGVSTTAEVAVR